MLQCVLKYMFINISYKLVYKATSFFTIRKAEKIRFNKVEYFMF
jgi:hypothetical protein